MDFIQVTSDAKNQIQAFEPGVLRINGQVYSHSVIVPPEQDILDWPVSSVAELTQANFEIFKSIKPDILLLGTGETLSFPETQLLNWLRLQKWGIEIMDTAAACRTFQILTAEKRKVIAALIL